MTITTEIDRRNAIACGVLVLAIAVAANIVGCGQRTEVAESKVNDDSSRQTIKHKEQHVNGEYRHHHAFKDPNTLATKWNDPKRDAWQHPEEIISALNLTAGATVADLGVGTGYMVPHLSNSVGEHGTVIAIDTEEAMLTFLMEHAESLGPATIVPREVSADSPQLAEGSVDSILVLDTWHHIRKREAYSTKLYAGLRAEGRIVIVDHEVNAETGPPKEMRLELEKVRKELESAGFRVEIPIESMPRHYMVIGYRQGNAPDAEVEMNQP